MTISNMQTCARCGIDNFLGCACMPDHTIYKRIFTDAGESETMKVDPYRLACIVANYGLERLIDDALGCRCFSKEQGDTAAEIVKARADLFSDLNRAHVAYNAAMGVT